MSREKAPVTKWSQGGENLLWKVPVGGRSTPIVMNGRVYSIAPVGDGECLQERVFCLDADTGKMLWEHRFNVFQTDIVEARVGWTSVVGDPETGNIYAHGTGGEFFCFDKDGKVIWKKSLGEEFGRYAGYGGRQHTPIVDEDRVIISFTYILAQWGTGPNKSGHRYYAFDKRTGDVLWWAQPGGQPQDTTYAVPVVAVIDGKRMLIAPNSDGYVYGLLSRTGEKVFGYRLSAGALNTAPVVDGNFVYVAQGEENIEGTTMGRVACFDASKTGDITQSGHVWATDGLEVDASSPALANGRVYVVTKSAMLHALDAKTGKVLWDHKLGTVGKSSPVVTSDGIIYAAEVNGRFHVLKDAGDKCESLDEKEFARDDKAVVEVYGSPAVTNGRVYFFTRYDAYCLGSKDRKPESVTIPPGPKESTARKDGGAEQKPRLMVVPAEATLAPGESISFKARRYDDMGRFVSDVALSDTQSKDSAQAPQLSVAGVTGAISPDGKFKAADASAFSAGVLTLKLDGAEANARIRIVPKLPITESFDKLKAGDPVPGWIGIDGKTKVAERDGGLVFQKLAERASAPYTRMYAFSGPPISAGYTVEADLLGEAPEGRDTLSDMGIINSRYELVLLGNEQVVRLVTWPPIPRLQKDVPFPWKPGTWYHALLRVELQGEKGLIRGKVWPKGEPEPSGWTVEFTDPCPNREGSPGLYAYTKGATPKRGGAPSFYDNYRVYRNE